MLEELEDQDDAVAARIERVREILGLNKREFAEAAGMTEQQYGPYSKGRRPLSLHAAKLLRKRYDLPLEFIYFGKIGDLPHRIAKEL